MLVKIVDLTHRRYEPVLRHPGSSGKEYRFKYDSAIGRYAFETDDQQVVDDLMEGAMVWRQTYFSVILNVSGPEKPAPAPQAEQAPVKRKRASRKRAVKRVSEKPSVDELIASKNNT